MTSKLISLLLCLVIIPCKADGIPVLMYHQITDSKPAGETVVSSDRFKNEMKYLHDNGYETLSVKDLLEIMTRVKSAPKKAVVLTFDDGWSSVLNAVPVLDSMRMKASFQIISGFEGRLDYLTSDQVKFLASNPNFEIQSHSVTHPWHTDDNLVTWDEGKTKDRSEVDVTAEIAASKLSLEHQLKKPVDTIAWPSGWYNEHMLYLAKQAGYKGSMMAWGNGGNHPGDDPFQIKRILVDGECNIDEFRQLIENLNSVKCTH